MNVPIYVTRPTSDKVIGNFSVSRKIALLMFAILLINFFGWGAFGIYELIIKVV